MESSLMAEKDSDWLNSNIGKWHMICTVSGEIINDIQILMPRMKENMVKTHWMNTKTRRKVGIMVMNGMKMYNIKENRTEKMVGLMDS